jgi:hypothetical protein
MLSRTDPSRLRRAERDGRISRERYYYIFKTEVDARIRAVIDRNRESFSE